MPLQITAPTEPIPSRNLLVVIYGDAGVGKSTLANSASQPLVLDFDNGLQRAMNRPHCVVVREWGDVAGITIPDLDPFDTVVVDTLGAMALTALRSVATTRGMMQTNGMPTQRGYGAVRHLFATFLQTLIASGKDVVFVAHSADEPLNDAYGNPTGEVRRYLDCAGGAKTLLRKRADAVGRLHLDERGRRFLDFERTNLTPNKMVDGMRTRYPVLATDADGGDAFMRNLLDHIRSVMPGAQIAETPPDPDVPADGELEDMPWE